MKVVLFCGGKGLRMQEASTRIPKPMIRIRYGWPAMRCHVPRSRPAAATFTSTSSSAMSGRATSASRSTSAEP